jgi:hypothetical protein
VTNGKCHLRGPRLHLQAILPVSARQTFPFLVEGGMSVSRRPTLALLVVVLLSVAITPRGGLYTLQSVVLAVTAMILALAACLLPDRRWQMPPEFGARIITYALILLGAQAFFLTFIHAREEGAEELAVSSPGLIKDEVAALVLVCVLGLLVVLLGRGPCGRQSSWPRVCCSAATAC